MRIAFKEWAVVVDALGRGEQILILRKGGLHEGRGGFRPEHARFLLFPTRFHQQREGVVPAAAARFDALAAAWPPSDRVRFEFVADVVATRWLPDRAAALALRGEHVWRDETVAAKADWGRQEGLHALVVRVARLPRPVELPLRPAYAGCKSWIELAADVDASGTAPVLGDAAFAARRARLAARLDGGGAGA
jgi:hypothetical protein